MPSRIGGQLTHFTRPAARSAPEMSKLSPYSTYAILFSASPSSSTISGVVAQLHMKRTVPSRKR